MSSSAVPKTAELHMGKSSTELRGIAQILTVPEFCFFLSLRILPLLPHLQQGTNHIGLPFRAIASISTG